MAVGVCKWSLTHKVLARGRYKVRSLMQALQLKAKRPKQHRYPIAGKPSQIAPNSLNLLIGVQYFPDQGWKQRP